MIPANVKQQVRDRLAEMTTPVTIELHVKPPSKLLVPGREEQNLSKETRELLEDVVECSDNVVLDVIDANADPARAAAAGIHGFPALVYKGGAGTLRFFGIPAGYEFAALLDDLIAVSNNEPGLKDSTLAALAAITQDVHLQVFTTPT